MAMHKLNDRGIATAIAAFNTSDTKEQLLSDGHGLYVRLRKGSVPSWLFVYTNAITKAKQKLVFGSYADNATSKARAWASTQRALLDKHIDPATTRRASQAERSNAKGKTLDTLLTAYVEYLRGAGKQSADDVENLFKNHVPDTLLRRIAIDIDYKEFVEMLNAMTNKQGEPIPRTQAKVQSYLRASYVTSTRADQQPGLPASLQGFGINAKTNPMLSVLANPLGASKPRHRTLSVEELKAYIKHVGALSDPVLKNLLLLQVYSGGQRMAQLIAGSVDGDTLVIIDAKGKRPIPRMHFTPLIGEALTLSVNHVPVTEIRANRALALRASGAVIGISKLMTGGGPFNLSDIRRTVETLLAANGISKDTRAQLLSHGISGVQDVHYDKYHYRPEKIKALKVLHKIIA